MGINRFFSLLAFNFICLITSETEVFSLAPTPSQPTPSHFSGTVNVITGSYSEVSTDLTLPGPKSQTIQRCFVGVDNGFANDGLSWHFNHPGILSESISEYPSDPLVDSKNNYSFDDLNRLTQLKITNTNGDKVYSSVDFEYFSEGDENVCEVTTSDGRQIFYCYTEGSITRGTPGVTINSMVDPMGNETRYLYRQHPNERKHLIKKIEDPRGGYIQTEYYDGKHNNVGGVLVTVNDPVRDFRIGRIKLQKEPVGPDGSPVITKTFFYHERSTDVVLANGQKTTYNYNDDLLITSIETFNHDRLHKVERFFWSAEVGDKLTKRLTSKTIENADGRTVSLRTYSYDDRGMLVEENLYGNITGTGSGFVDINDNGQPSSSDQEHATWKYFYELYGDDDASRIIKQIDPSGKTTQYRYDDDTLRISATFVGQEDQIHIRQFNLYNEDGLLIETITDDGSSESPTNLQGVTERYIAKYTLRTSQPAYGMPEVIEERYYDVNSASELLSKKTICHYNGCHKAIQQDVYGANDQFMYSIYQNFDALGRKISKSDPSGKEIFWDYDANGNIVHELIKAENESSKSVKNVYDTANRLIKVVRSTDNVQDDVTSYRYNTMSQKAAVINQHGNQTHFDYDQLGRLVSITKPTVFTDKGTFEHPKEVFTYDIFNNCIEASDPNRYITKKTYNILGNPTEITYPDGTKEKFEYNIDGSLKKQVNKNGIAKVFQRDYQGRVTKEQEVAPSGRVLFSVTNTYNSFHLMNTMDSRGIQTHYEYNAEGRQKAVNTINKDGIKKVAYEYDIYGYLYAKKEWFGEGPDEYTMVITERDQSNNVREIKVQDSNGNILHQRNLINKEPSVNSNISTEQSYGPDKRGQLTYQENITDSQGTTSHYTYDALGRVIAVVKRNSRDQVLSDIEIRYDLAGNKVKEIHQSIDGQKNDNYIISWKYGPNNRLEAFVEGEGSREQRTTLYSYNGYGQLETVIKPDRVTLTHYYNDAGLISRFFSSDNTIDYEYLYDEYGHVTQVIDRISATVSLKAYNGAGLITEETLSNGLTLCYTYDKIGRRTSYSLPDHTSVSYTYDAANLQKVTRNDANKNTVYSHEYTAYNLEGSVLIEKFIKGCGNIYYQYDESGNRISATSPWWSETVGWESHINCPNIHLNHLSIVDPLGETQHHFKLDEESRVVQETGVFNHNYSYDTFGNISSFDNEKLSTNIVNELIHDGEYHYVYDANGNLTEKVNEVESYSFQYDALNRLTSVTIDDLTKVTYNYDPQSRRTQKIFQERNPDGQWETTDIRKHIYVDNNEVGEVNAYGKMISHKILGLSKGSDIGATVAIEIDNTTYACVNDYRGNIACLINSTTGEVKEFYRYNAFGENIIFDENLKQKDADEALNPWRYCSKRVDCETSFVFFGKRFYAPNMKKWITVDPLGYVDGINRYCFVHNNPLENIDHYGLISLASAWDSFLTLTDNFLNIMMDLGSKSLNFIRNKTQYLKQIQPSLTSVLEEYFGKGFLTLTGYYSHPLEAGVYGQGEISDKVRITLLNGISNIRSYYRDSLELLNSTHGGVNIHYIFRPTSGWCGDMIMALFIKCGYVSPYAKELAATWKEMIAEMGGVDGGGTIIHYCHSLGGTDSVVAAGLLTPEERAMIKVISFGSATMISNNVGFGDVINFVSIRDGVCLLDPIGYIKGLMGADTNIAFIGTFLGIPLVDHSLAMETYTETITNLGHVFLQMYAYVGGLL